MNQKVNGTGSWCIESELVCARLILGVGVQDQAPEAALARQVRQLVARKITQPANPYQ